MPTDDDNKPHRTHRVHLAPLDFEVGAAKPARAPWKPARSDDLTRWIKLDYRFLHREATQILLNTFGPAGPLVLLAIVLEVEGSENGRASDTIEVYFGPLARLLATPEEVVRTIVRALSDLGLIEVSVPRPRPLAPWEHGSAKPWARSVVVRLVQRPRWAPEERREARDAKLRAREPRLGAVPTDHRVIAVLRAAERPLRGRELAEAIGLSYSGSFKTRLARLRREGRIVSTNAGYTAVER